jgi:hypothetical protein
MARQGPSGDKQMDDRRLDETVIDSFPASDPPSHSGITGIGRPHVPGQASEQKRRPFSHMRGHESRPTRSPHLGSPCDRDRPQLGG